ncbi:MAG: amidophosphoribosyltransferase [Candidatus Gracilibacteria bacterium]
MCGVVGIYGSDEVAYELYDAMLMLQHRGQDACGMGVFDGQHFNIHKELGLTRDVFKAKEFEELHGNVGIGHLRYPTVNGCKTRDAQPFFRTSPYGILLAHNGTLPHYKELKDRLARDEHVLVNSDNDSEIILHILAKAIARQKPHGDLTVDQVFDAMKEVYEKITGGFFVVAYIAGQGMLAFRDPNGIRPGIFGKRETKLSTDYIFASESVALGLLDFEVISDVGNGEAIFIDNKRQVHRKKIMDKKHKPCIFEYVYFSRPDSVLDGVSVYKSRLQMGRKLARQIKESGLDIDVVCPVPDTSRSTAIALAYELGLKLREGLIRNRYIGRTFIMPGQTIRKKSIRYKLSPNVVELEGKNVLLVDDSIVRGNTSKQIIDIVRQAGAKKVYFASAAPMLTYPCLYGIDLPSRKEYIANELSLEGIKQAIGADALFYQTLDDLVDAVKYADVDEFCLACFDGNYITGDISEELLKKNEQDLDMMRSCSKAYDTSDDAGTPGQPGML